MEMIPLVPQLIYWHRKTTTIAGVTETGMYEHDSDAISRNNFFVSYSICAT